MDKRANVAVVGATGAVGKTMIEILEERNFPIETLFPLASERSAGTKIDFRQQQIVVQDLATFDFSQVSIALFSAGGSVSRDYAEKAASQGCVVIDNTSYFRYENDIPLVVSEVNPEDIAHYRNHNIIANPNCSTMQMLAALKPIYDEVGISRINVATYQAVSGAGQSAIEELANQTAYLLNGKEAPKKVFSRQIAFNVIPKIDQVEDNGYTKEEMKMVWETQKIFHDHNIQVNPTCVRVPVFYGHSEAVHIETDVKITAERARELLNQAPGIQLLDDIHDDVYPTPVTEGAGLDPVFVGRIREDVSHPLGLDLWIVADNVRKGAALNSVQLAEILLNQYL